MTMIIFLIVGMLMGGAITNYLDKRFQKQLIQDYEAQIALLKREHQQALEALRRENPES